MLQACCQRQLVVTVAANERGGGQRGCLWLYPLPEWEKFEQKILALPSLNKISVNLRRFVIGNACECDMDSQGRLLLPEKLRQVANLDKRITLVGQLNKFELWNESSWSADETAWLDSTDSEGLAELGGLSF